MSADMQLPAAELQKIKILDLAEGREFIGAIEGRQRTLLEQLRQPLANAEWNKLNDEGYELRKAKRHIQQQMGKLVKARH
jgi:hypothetical protein